MSDHQERDILAAVCHRVAEDGTVSLWQREKLFRAASLLRSPTPTLRELDQEKVAKVLQAHQLISVVMAYGNETSSGVREWKGKCYCGVVASSDGGNNGAMNLHSSHVASVIVSTFGVPQLATVATLRDALQAMFDQGQMSAEDIAANLVRMFGVPQPTTPDVSPSREVPNG